VNATLSPKTVETNVRSRLAQIRVCYEVVLRRDVNVSGKIVVHWTINLGGSAESVSIESDTTNDIELRECIRDLIAGWKFPPPQGGTVEISFPFVFQRSANLAPAKPQ
jgi:hypothetical protein